MAITDEIPKSRITLTYRTTVRGEPEEVAIPFRVLVMGDLTGKATKDRTDGALDKRPIRRLDGKNLNQVMADMNMSIVLKDVPNKINPTTSNKGTIEVTVPVTSTKSFLPAEVANQVPQIKALLLLKKLLLEAQSKFDNQPKFRNNLREAAKNSANIKSLVAELPSFGQYKLPAAKLKLDAAAMRAALSDAERGKLEVWRRLVEPGAEAERVADEELDQEIRVRPGDYEIRAFVPGKAEWKGVVTVVHDATATLAIPVFA